MKRREVAMLLTVSIPHDMTIIQARREVRTLINEQCNWSADPGDMKVRRIQTARGTRR